MKRIAAFRALPAGDKGLLLRACWLLLLVRSALPFVSVDRLRRWAARSGRDGPPVARLVNAVRRAARIVPGVTCLAAALALQQLMSRAGHASELRIGVARREGSLAAHAWLVHDGAVLIGGEESASFAGLLAWPGGADPA